jgi:hypothetical protein
MRLAVTAVTLFAFYLMRARQVGTVGCAGNLGSYR